MRRKRLILMWAYLVEVVLVVIVYTLMWQLLGANKLVEVMAMYWYVFVGVGGAILALGVAFALWFWQGLDSEFGKYLKWRKVDRVYIRAYEVQLLLFFTAVALPSLMAFGRCDLLAHLSWCAVLYASVNALTNIRNTVGIVNLRQTFKSNYDATNARLKNEDSD